MISDGCIPKGCGMIKVALKAAFGDIVPNLKRAYYNTAYCAIKATLEPVVAAINDVVREAVLTAVREGIRDALSPSELFGVLLRKKK